jgi:hypothetical protein
LPIFSIEINLNNVEKAFLYEREEIIIDVLNQFRDLVVISLFMSSEELEATLILILMRN